VKPHDLEDDLRPGRPLEALDGVGEPHVARARAVDGEHPVTGRDAGALGRRVRDGRDDHELIALHPQLDPHPIELARRLFLERPVHLGSHELAVRIEPRHHPLDGAVHQILLLHLLDVAVLDVGEDVGEHVQRAVGLTAVAASRAGGVVHREAGEEGCAHGGAGEETGAAHAFIL